MGEGLDVKYCKNRGNYKLSRYSIGIVKYANNFVIICKTKEEALIMCGELNYLYYYSV